MGASYTIELIKIFVENEDSGWFSGSCRAIPDPDRDRKLDFPGEMQISGVFKYKAEGVPYRINAELGEFRRRPQLTITKGTIPERIEGLIDLDGVDRYLDFIKRAIDDKRSLLKLKPAGIGPVKLRGLVNQYGLESIKIAREDPEKVADETKGWTVEKAVILSEELVEHIESEMTMVELTTLGANRALSAKNREALLDKYGMTAPDHVRTDPYALIEELRGYGFAKADTLATMNLLWPESSPARITAGSHEALRTNERDGHCYIATTNLIINASILTGQPKTYHKALLEIDADVFHDGRFCYSRKIKEAEDAVVELVKFQSDRVRHPERVTKDDRDISDSLNTLQREAFVEAIKGGFLVITGGPGRGKTHTCKSIIQALNNRSLQVLILAPTGRAASRAAELTGSSALTIHSYLKRKELGQSFDEINTFLIDESSMIDIFLMASFLKSLSKNQNCIFIGDCDQLPAVGPGSPFYSVIESGIIESVRLTEIMRTDKRGLIEAAQIVNSGLQGSADRLRVISCDSFQYLNAKGGEARSVVISLVERLTKEGTPAESIQIITATNGYKSYAPEPRPMTNRDFNLELGSILNPDGERTKAKGKGDPLSTGDRIMNLVNNSSQKFENKPNGPLMNGEIGTVIGINIKELATKKPDGTHKEALSLKCDFDGRIVLKKMNADDIVQCFAATCHKFQGSESPVVIVVFDQSASRIIDRSWLYTAITRASSKCFLVAPSKSINHAVSTESKLKSRRSFLLDRLTGNHKTKTTQTLEM
jgi:exodeoxyribonuclease V alpha subunit